MTLLRFANSARFAVSRGFYMYNPDHGLHFISNIQNAFLCTFRRNDSGMEEDAHFHDMEVKIGASFAFVYRICVT